MKSLCNLALLTGHIGRWGSGLVPLRGQNNVQGGGDMGALPNKFPGFQDITNPDHRAKFEAAYGMELNPNNGKHLTLMLEAMEHGEIKAAYCIGENPADSEASAGHSRALLEGLDILVVQDIFMTATASLPTSSCRHRSVGPSATAPSPRRSVVCSVRAAVTPPGACRHDHEIIGELAKRMGVDSWGDPTPQELWDELRSLSPLHAGMSYERLEAEGGLQWPCPSEDHPGSPFLHGWLWEDDLGGRAPSPFSITEHEGPKEQLTDEFRCASPRVVRSTPTTPVSSPVVSRARFAAVTNST